jgi:hypothetical protein
MSGVVATGIIQADRANLAVKFGKSYIEYSLPIIIIFYYRTEVLRGQVPQTGCMVYW